MKGEDGEEVKRGRSKYQIKILHTAKLKCYLLCYYYSLVCYCKCTVYLQVRSRERERFYH